METLRDIVVSQGGRQLAVAKLVYNEQWVAGSLVDARPIAEVVPAYVMSHQSPRRLQPLCDRIGRGRVEAVVARFYDRLEMDPQLGGYFASLPDLQAHRQRIADFWWLAMGGRLAEPPQVDMIGAHSPLGLGRDDFSRWLALFEETLQQSLPADLANQWLQMAQAVAQRLMGQVVDR